MEKKESKIPKCSLKMGNHFISAIFVAIGIVLVWRGIWNLLDIYFLPNYPILSNLIGIFVGLLILYLPDKDLKELL